MILNKKEKEKMVIKLANEGKTTREIAKEVHIPLKTIGQILNKVTGKDKSDYAKAFKMFRDGRPLTEVAIELDIESPTVICYYEDYLKLVNMRKLATIYNDTKDDLPLFFDLLWRIKKERLTKPQISELLKIPNRLLDWRKMVDLHNDHKWNLHTKKNKLEKEIEEKMKRLLAL